MCDTLVVVESDRVLFAKNSDRDVNEAQCFEWIARMSHPPDSQVRCTWISIPQVRKTHALMISRPFWMWGAEMGTNEHDVTIGNEAVFTRQPVQREGLTGMDLLRLALERSESAPEAVDVIVGLMREFGQGGGCGHEKRSFAYHSSFLIADPRSAFLLETAGREWALEAISGPRTISNCLTIPDFAGKHSKRAHEWIASGPRRQSLTREMVHPQVEAIDLMRILRHHGSGAEPCYSWLNGAMAAPCMHAGGLLVGSQTTGSWVAELRPEASRHWVTATAAPCTSLFKPATVNQPLNLGPPPRDRFDPASLWWRHELLHRRVMRNPGRLFELFTRDRDALEQEWTVAPPGSDSAFLRGEQLLGEWTEKVLSTDCRDVRPFYVRRYWHRRNRAARFPPL